MSSKRSSKATTKVGGTKKSLSAANANNGMKTSNVGKLAMPSSATPASYPGVKPYFKVDHTGADTKADCWNPKMTSCRVVGRELLTYHLSPSPDHSNYDQGGFFAGVRYQEPYSLLVSATSLGIHPLIGDAFQGTNASGNSYPNFGVGNLARIAYLFAKYKFRRFALHYVPYCSTTDVGGVVLAINEASTYGRGIEEFLTPNPPSGLDLTAGPTILKSFPNQATGAFWSHHSVSEEWPNLRRTRPVSIDLKTSVESVTQDLTPIEADTYFQGRVYSANINSSISGFKGIYFIEYDVDLYDMTGDSPAFSPYNKFFTAITLSKPASSDSKDEKTHSKSAAVTVPPPTEARPTTNGPDKLAILDDYIVVKKSSSSQATKQLL